MHDDHPSFPQHDSPAGEPAAEGQWSKQGASPVSFVTAVIAWTVIVSLVGFIVVANIVQKAAMEGGEGPDPIGLKVMELQSKFMVAQHVLGGSSDQAIEMAEQTLNLGTIDQRLRYVVVAGEMGGAAEALDTLDDLRTKVDEVEEISFTEEQTRLADTLETLYRDYEAENFAAPSLTGDQESMLRNDLGWFGRLALTPAQGPDDQGRQAIASSLTMLVIGVSVAVVAIATIALGGLVGLIIVIIMLAGNRIQSGMGPRVARHHILIETFAIWMIAFFGLSMVIGSVGIPDRHAMAAQAVGFFLSLGVLAWPIVRGMSFREVREGIGWTSGKSIAIEPWFGAGAYAMTLPLLGVGVLIVLLLMQLTGAGISAGQTPAEEFRPSGGAAHPIIQFVGEGDVWAILQLYLLAAIAAPIVEETMFRGVLYKYLRSSTRWMGTVLSILLGTLINGLIFAIIHPQGLIAVPALLALATGMTLIREWRGSLIPSIVLHGISNGIVMTLMVLAFSA